MKKLFILIIMTISLCSFGQKYEDIMARAYAIDTVEWDTTGAPLKFIIALPVPLSDKQTIKHSITNSGFIWSYIVVELIKGKSVLTDGYKVLGYEESFESKEENATLYNQLNSGALEKRKWLKDASKGNAELAIKKYWQ